jgi:hypothetical protein
METQTIGIFVLNKCNRLSELHADGLGIEFDIVCKWKRKD